MQGSGNEWVKWMNTLSEVRLGITGIKLCSSFHPSLNCHLPLPCNLSPSPQSLPILNAEFPVIRRLSTGWAKAVWCRGKHEQNRHRLENWLSLVCVCVLVSQSCPTLCDPMDYSPAGSAVHGILQAKILEWVAIPFSQIFPTQGSNLGLLQAGYPLLTTSYLAPLLQLPFLRLLPPTSMGHCKK